jgi:hypothetical protein
MEESKQPIPEKLLWGFTRKRLATLAGAILITLALPIAFAQEYFIYNPYLLPILGLVAIILYLIFFLTSQFCEKSIHSFYLKSPKLSLLIFIIISITVLMLLGIGEWVAIQKSINHVNNLLTKKYPQPLQPPQLVEQTEQKPIEKPSTSLLEKQPTAEEIATELAKKLPSKVIQPSREKEIPQKEPTFKDITPFTVIVGSNSAEIPKDASVKKPQHIVKIGDTDVIDAYVENEKLYVNTILYGSPTLAAVEIKHNEFIVRPPQWDRNFDDTALEIVDENLLPRLQLVYKTPRTVVINGIFKFSGGLVLMEEDGLTYNPSSFKPKFRRIFKYPSRLYQGQELDEPHL